MKEENIKSEYQRKVDKSLIPTCNIMGVNIAAINMNWLLKYIDENLSDIKGDYICVSNVHTTVTSYEDAAYCAVQNGGLMAIPDGGPLSSVGRKRGYSDMDRTTGPSLMGEIFKISAEKGYSRFKLRLLFVDRRYQNNENNWYDRIVGKMDMQTRLWFQECSYNNKTTLSPLVISELSEEEELEFINVYLEAYLNNVADDDTKVKYSSVLPDTVDQIYSNFKTALKEECDRPLFVAVYKIYKKV